ncbi:polysaccharide deacetylase family protein [Deinococcus rubellus]|uniref:Polysaccharide deacetylase family protein n=2 Tax=Deinococcus rubellus TaxID=1889240 RepID=A0ABY5YHB5_9DEIO|nr:polysaccharide deacetylase family protein [Deinococcus rubellus]UWX63561.1 polysaccharide deacetylase family protein [Deinococcus rubellus]
MGTSLAQPAPGQIQPVAPGTRTAPRLQTLALTPPLPEVKTVEVLSNGFVRAAHAIILLSGAQTTDGRATQLALLAAERTYRAAPDLLEVDVSVYRAKGYAGFGGPLPLLTLSVPRERLATVRTSVQTDQYDRIWINPQIDTPEVIAPPAKLLEKVPVFVGSRAEQLKQQLQQSLSHARGGVRGGLLFQGPSSRRQVALTFDDGPHPLYFPLVLDLLRRADVKATFFLIGRNAVAYPYFVQDLVRGGFEIANHTFHHVRLPSLSTLQIKTELSSTNTLLTQLGGQNVLYFRPPGGRYSTRVLNIARQLGLTTVFWTDDPGDFQNPGVETVEARFGKRLRPGGIILLHDNALDGLLALPDLLKVARQRGYTVTTVGALGR